MLIRTRGMTRLQVLNEWECCIKGFIHLTFHLPRRHLLQPFAKEDALATAADFYKNQIHVIRATSSKTGHRSANSAKGGSDVETESAPRQLLERDLLADVGYPFGDDCSEAEVRALAEAEPDVFPCLLFVAASCHVCFKARLNTYL